MVSAFFILFLTFATTSLAASQYRRIIVFGDSLSDVGTYSQQAAAYGGKKYTTNPGKLWIEHVGGALNLPVTPARYEGFGLPPIQLNGSNYAQGGARVTTERVPLKPNDISARPIAKQVASFLASRSGKFLPSDLVFLQGGANDVFAQINDLAQGKISPQQAIQNVTLAGIQLKQIAQLLSRSYASHLYVLNLPMIEKTPLVLRMQPKMQALVKQMVQAFNAQLPESRPMPSHHIIDIYNFDAAIYSRAAEFRFKNVTSPACNLKVLPDTSSLYCNAKTLVEPNADLTYKYADMAHPSTGYSAIIGKFILSQIDGVSLSR
jgi:phospholipase/lecithinase/hemolysin